jgi:hypothetical protein
MRGKSEKDVGDGTDSKPRLIPRIRRFLTTVHTEILSAAHVGEAAAYRALDRFLVPLAAAERGYVTVQEGVARVMESRFDRWPGSRSRQ